MINNKNIKIIFAQIILLTSKQDLKYYTNRIFSNKRIHIEINACY